MSGFVVWFTGLSGAGKSTLAAMLSAEIRARGVHVEVLDGDEVRTYLSKGLGFSREDRDTNVRRIGYVAKLVARAGACAVTAAISPYSAARDEQRRQIPSFVEVYCACAIAALVARDPKGLYRKALAGEIQHFTGVNDPYEPPEDPEVTVHTDQESPEESLAKILGKLEELGHVAHLGHHGAAPGAAARGWRGLVAPHGGELIDRRAHGPAREALAARAPGLPAIDLDERSERDVDLIASGALSPLRGFMGSKDYLRVVREMRLERGLLWPLPITLAIDEDRAARLRAGGEAALRARDGRIVAVMAVDDLWRPDRELEAREIHGTADPAHPGVARLLRAGPVYVGGEILALDWAAPRAFPAHDLAPAEARARLVERGFRRVVGFQTGEPMLRPEEHLTKAALETCDALLVRARVGAAGPGDLPDDVRVRCYEALLAGYYPPERALLSVAPPARGAGPREAVLDALVCKNHGGSHFLVGPDRAVQALLDELAPVELGIAPLCIEDAFYSAALGAMATSRTAPGDASTRVHLSAAELRAQLLRGEPLPPEICRPEVARLLAAALGTASPT